MSNDYFEEQFMKETFQEEVMGKNTYRNWNCIRHKKNQKVSLINSSSNDLKTADGV